MNILVTGSAGFIGFHVAKKLLKKGYKVLGIDNHNDYYDQALKENRLNVLNDYEKYKHFRVDLDAEDSINEIFSNHNIRVVINLAAQAGVRYSIENPKSYIKSNLNGFFNILNCSKEHNIEHFIYASSSSVYGANEEQPYSESHHTASPLSLYAATKRSNEIIAHSYSSLFKINTTGLRFFTVYGPWGRPDMALYKFTEKIIKGEEIEVFNEGKHIRDFTYIDDVVKMILTIMKDYPFKEVDNSSAGHSTKCPWRIFNIGNGNPQPLMTYINEIESKLGVTARKKFLPLQDGDVPETSADISKFEEFYGYGPLTQIKEGVGNFIDWYKEYEGI